MTPICPGLLSVDWLCKVCPIMRARSIFALFAGFVLAAHAHAEAGCSRPAIIAAAASVHNARTALIAVPVADMDTDVPPPAREAIEHFKDGLKAYVEATLACTRGSASAAAIATALRSQGDAGKRGPDKDGHGQALDYAVQTLPHHPGWIAIIPSFQIECGGDAIALFYSRKGAGWHEVMVNRSAPYNLVSGGWYGLDIHAPPAGPDGRWYIALVHDTSWCTSVWSAVHFQLVRPTANPLQPNIFLKDDLDDNLNFAHVVTATPRWFEIRAADWSHDTGILYRTSIHRWAIDGDRTHRVPPVAPTAQDFTDEWIQTPWREASGWGAPGLAAWHKRLGFSDTEKTALDTTFDRIRGCPGNRVEVALQPDSGPDVYLMVGRKGLAFRMLAIARRHDPFCVGANQLRQRPLLSEQ